MLYINYPATLTKTTCWRRRYKAAWPFLTIVLFYWHSVLFDGSIKGWNYLNTLIISVLSCVSDNYVMRLSERNNPLNCHFLSEDSFREIGDRDPISKIQESDLSSCCKVGLYYHGYSYHSVLLYYVIAGSFLIKCSPQNDNKVQCDWPVCCHAVSWNAETFFPFYLSVSSLELGCKQKKKLQPGLEKICALLSRFSPRWTLECPSPMCFSTTVPEPSSPSETRICMVLLWAPAWSQRSSLWAYLQCILFLCGSCSFRFFL